MGNGKKTLCNGRQVSCRLPKSISEATLLTSDEADVRIHQNYDNWLALSKRVNFSRTWGDCYGYFLVATGKADIMADPIVSPWDVFGAIPILEGAGVKVSAWNGENVPKCRISGHFDLFLDPLTHKMAPYTAKKVHLGAHILPKVYIN